MNNRPATPRCIKCEQDPLHSDECVIVYRRYIPVARICSACGCRFNIAGRRNARAKRCPECRAKGGAR